MADASPSASSSSPADVLTRLLAIFPPLIEEKIRCIFDNLDDDDMVGLIQFWAPVKIKGKWILTTSDQPFLLDDDIASEKYRSFCMNYKYNIDVNYKVQVEKEDPTIISNGAPATAFLNQLPEFVRDLKVHEMSPLASFAVECGLHRSLVLPALYPSQSCCVGVFECCSSLFTSLIDMLDDLNTALKKEGFELCQLQENLPYKTICSLKHVENDIDEAIELVWQRVCMNFSQVWIAYKDEDHMAFSSSLENNRTERMLGFKLTDRVSDSYRYYDYVDEDNYVSKRFVGYSRICNLLSLKMGKGLVGKTLQNYAPHFVKNLSKLSNDEPQMLLSSSEMEGLPYHCSCFVICLKTTETSDLEYVFEFIWRESSNYVKLLELILISLKKRLPNFKYASGAELGDELHIVDVENSTEREIGCFKIFQGKKSSSTSKELEKERPVIKECEETPSSLSKEDIIEAAKNPNVCLSTLKRKCSDLDIERHRKDYVKRNVNHSYKNESDKSEENEEAFQDPLAENKEMYLDENSVTIKAEYADDMIKFRLPVSSATFVAIGEEIGKRLKLDPANYKLKYLDEDGDWILLTCDEDIKICIKDRRNLSSIVRLRLLP